MPLIYTIEVSDMTLQLPYGEALTAVFLEGIIFFILAVTGVRGAIIRLVPR